MYLRDIAIYAAETIAARFASGFVGRLHRETCCVTESYCSMLGDRVVTRDSVKVNLCFTEQEGLAPTIRQLIRVADVKWGPGRVGSGDTG
jgi:hypothetical protein